MLQIASTACCIYILGEKKLLFRNTGTIEIKVLRIGLFISIHLHFIAFLNYLYISQLAIAELEEITVH